MGIIAPELPRRMASERAIYSSKPSQREKLRRLPLVGNEPAHAASGCGSARYSARRQRRNNSEELGSAASVLRPPLTVPRTYTTAPFA